MYGVQSLVEVRGAAAAEQLAADMAGDVSGGNLEPHPAVIVAFTAAAGNAESDPNPADGFVSDPYGLDQVFIMSCTHVCFLV